MIELPHYSHTQLQTVLHAIYDHKLQVKHRMRDANIYILPVCNALAFADPAMVPSALLIVLPVCKQQVWANLFRASCMSIWLLPNWKSV